MKLLIIEDEQSFLNEMREALKDIPSLEVNVASSRRSAVDKLRRFEFDLITCDLKIPTQDGGLDAHVDHGRAAYQEALNVTPGTPIIVFSAFGSLETLPALINVAHIGDYFGTNTSLPMVSFFDKGRMPDCVEKISEFAEQIDILDGIEISPPGFQLAYFEKRALRIFARRLEGTVVTVSKLGGGLSKTRTLKVKIKGAGGVHKALVAAKLGAHEIIDDEKRRYEKFVSPALGAGAYAGFAGEVNRGAGKIAALFFTLDDRYDRSAFDVLRDAPDKGESVVKHVTKRTRPWRIDAPQLRTTVGDIRRSLFSDDSLAASLHYLDGIDIEAFEAKELEVRRCAQHCDFHGENVLADAEHRTLLIDYGEVGEATASLDPIILELSLLFHPDKPDTKGGWPTLDQVASWDNLDEYTKNCPFADFIRACRAWAFDAAAGGREVFANLYGYAIRQLGYGDTNKDFAVALVHVAMRGFDST